MTGAPGPIADGRILVATRNPHKLEEIRRALDGLSLELVSPVDLALPELSEEEELEPFTTFAQNALSKAGHFHERSGLRTLADDSGICVDALGGGPGVRTKRFAPGAMASEFGRDEANNAYLLERLRGTPPARRTARYRCALALVGEGESVVLEGTVEGSIAEEPRGHGGFGYDPLFVPEGYDATYGELSPSIKEATSHRARALQKLRSHLSGAAGGSR